MTVQPIKMISQRETVNPNTNYSPAKFPENCMKIYYVDPPLHQFLTMRVVYVYTLNNSDSHMR